MHRPPHPPKKNRRIAKPAPATMALALAGIGGIIFATLCPVGLRPHFASANEERFGAYAVLGLILAFAFSRRQLAVSAFVVLLAAGLEFGQLLIPTRDARLIDALVKAAGGLAGSSVGYAFFPARRLLQRFVSGRRPARGQNTHR